MTSDSTVRRSAHWDGVYTSRDEEELTWFQPSAACSLDLLDALGVTPADSVVDVGAGASRLVDALLERGFTDVTVLDVSEAGLARARRRLGPAAARVHWITTDLLAWSPEREFDVWHDRAVFHFLTDPQDVSGYRDVLNAAVGPGGLVVVGTFAEDGPTRCSGLPVARYSAARLADALGDGFEVVANRHEEHRTPSGGVQPFTWVAFRVRGAPA